METNKISRETIEGALQVKKAFEDCLSILAYTYPVFYFYLTSKRILYTKRIDYAVTNEKLIALGKEFLTLQRRDQVVVLMHEVLHDFLKHCRRCKAIANRYQSIAEIAKVVNTLADAKVNLMLMYDYNKSNEILYDAPKVVAKMLNLEYKEIHSLSLEELVEMLLKRFPRNLPSSQKTTMMQDLLPEESDIFEDAVEIQQGVSSEDNDKIIERAITRARIAHAGKTPGYLEKLIEIIFKREIDWKKLLKIEILEWQRKNVVEDYRVENRRNSELPGIRSVATPRVWVLVDISGSVWDIAHEFISEVYGAIKEGGEAILILWDTDIRLEKRIKSLSDFPRKITGGGGTLLSPVLEKVAKRVRNSDIVVIFTDKEWGDEERAYSLLRAMKGLKYIVTDEKKVEKVR